MILSRYRYRYRVIVTHCRPPLPTVTDRSPPLPTVTESYRYLRYKRYQRYINFFIKLPHRFSRNHFAIFLSWIFRIL